MKNFYPAVTDVIRHVDLIKCVKLPGVRASLSRHSNCYVALKPLLGARLACWRLFPPPCGTNSSQLPQLIWRENGMEMEIVLPESK